MSHFDPGDTVSHDSHNLTVVGTDRVDMLTACRVLAASGGGIALVRGGKVIAQITLPIAGLISRRPVAEVAKEVAGFQQAAAEAGLTADNAFMGIVTLTLAVSQEGKLSNLGLIDVEKQVLLPMEVE